MNEKKLLIKTTVKYTIIGSIFGLCFPLGAYFFQSILLKMNFNFENIIIFHKNTPILFMIDTAPLFLGIFSLIGGISRAQAEVLNEKQKMTIKELKTSSIKTEDIAVEIKNIALNLKSNIKDSSSNIFEITTLAKNSKDSMIDITSNVKQQTVETEEIFASITNINESIENILNNSKNSLDISNFALLQANDGLKSLSIEVDSLKVIENLMNIIYGRFTEFINLTNQIKGISDSISSISNRSNLLALNASIEASKAGDAGKGFAIVASEIRKLSEQSKKASETINEITTKIKVSVNQTTKSIEEGKKDISLQKDESEKIEEKFVTIISKMTESNKTLESVVFSINEQASRIDEIKATVGNITHSCEEIEDAIIKQLGANSTIAHDTENMKFMVDSSLDVSDSLEKFTLSMVEISKNLSKII